MIGIIFQMNWNHDIAIENVAIIDKKLQPFNIKTEAPILRSK